MSDTIQVYKKRRQRGSGGLYIEARGYWTGVIDLGKDADGKRIRKTVSGKVFCKTLGKFTEISKLRPFEPRPRRTVGNRQSDMRRARALGDHNERDWVNKVVANQSKCFYCGRTTNILTQEKDHVVPISRGGSNSIDNVVVACYPCNRGKSDMTVEEWVSIGSPTVNKRKNALISYVKPIS